MLAFLQKSIQLTLDQIIIIFRALFIKICEYSDYVVIHIMCLFNTYIVLIIIQNVIINTMYVFKIDNY